VGFFQGFSHTITLWYEHTSHITDKANAGSVLTPQYLPPSFRTHPHRTHPELSVWLKWLWKENLIQMSSDVINYNSTCHSGFSRHLSTTCLDYFVFPYLENNVLKNCNLIDVPGPDFAKVI
jgi:hypothetical protein